MAYIVYILVSEKDGSLYTGQTSNIIERVRMHNSGRVVSTRNHAPFSLAYYESFESRSKAMHNEWELKKKWNTERKKKLIRDFDSSLITSLLGL